MSQDNDAQQRGAANRLYWESDASVAEIAEKLGLSRRALYDAVHPRPAGAICPECDADLVFRTRTAQMLGEAECLECGLEHEIETLREATAEAGPAMRRRADASERTEMAEPTAEAGAERSPTRESTGEPAAADPTSPPEATGPAHEPEPEIERPTAAAASDAPPRDEEEAVTERSAPAGLGGELEPWLRERASWLGGAALAGVIVGAAAAWLSSRR